jgi:hypothetical protein
MEMRVEMNQTPPLVEPLHGGSSESQIQIHFFVLVELFQTGH